MSEKQTTTNDKCRYCGFEIEDGFYVTDGKEKAHISCVQNAAAIQGCNWCNKYTKHDIICNIDGKSLRLCSYHYNYFKSYFKSMESLEELGILKIEYKPKNQTIEEFLESIGIRIIPVEDIPKGMFILLSKAEVEWFQLPNKDLEGRMMIHGVVGRFNDD